MSDPLSAEAEPLPLLPISSAATVRKCSRLTLRKHDVFVASFPKSGTTWMQHILHTLATDGQSPLAHVSDACPFFEIDRTWADEEAAVLSDAVRANHDKIGRRIFNTHLRWQMMPRDSSDARYVYMVRRPTDACVSFWRSEPARSIMLKREVLVRFTPPLTPGSLIRAPGASSSSCSSVSVMAMDRENTA